MSYMIVVMCGTAGCPHSGRLRTLDIEVMPGVLTATTFRCSGCLAEMANQQLDERGTHD